MASVGRLTVTVPGTRLSTSHIRVSPSSAGAGIDANISSRPKNPSAPNRRVRQICQPPEMTTMKMPKTSPRATWARHDIGSLPVSVSMIHMRPPNETLMMTR